MFKSKAPNVKAPRFRSKSEASLNIEMLNEISQNVISAKGLSNNEIKEIILRFNSMLWENVISIRDGVELPNQLGHVFIGTCPRKKTPNVDFKRTGEMNMVIQHRNWESDNYLAKIFYTSYGKRYSFRHKELWVFKPTRIFTREVGRTYPKYWKRYIEIDPMKKISTIFRKKVEKLDATVSMEENLGNYNEFEI